MVIHLDDNVITLYYTLSKVFKDLLGDYTEETKEKWKPKYQGNCSKREHTKNFLLQ